MYRQSTVAARLTQTLGAGSGIQDLCAMTSEAPPNPIEYDEPAVLTEYVCAHCVPHMNDFERAGLKVVLAREKAANTDSVHVREMILKKWAHQADPKVEAALADGPEKFRQAVRDRVLRDHPEVVNRCPKCSRVVRTPRAKQCRWCFHDWH